jgi:hypothetical protein
MGFFFPSSSLFFCTRNENDDLPGMLVDWMSWMSIYIIYLNDRKKRKDSRRIENIRYGRYDRIIADIIKSSIVPRL